VELGLSGKWALVTGASQGIGFAIAEALSQEGANVVLASRSLTNIEKAISQIKNPKGQLVAATVDMSQEKSIRDLVGSLKNPMDILVTNSGGPVAGFPTELKLEDWDHGYHEVLRSVLILTELLVPKMREKKWGRILNITSTAAKEIIPKLPISATFRAGLCAFVTNLAKEIGRDGVLINNLLPGPTDTARLQHLEEKSPDFFRSMTSEIAVGRTGKPQEVARTAAYLCSEANSFMTGSNVVVDGGYLRGY